MDKKLLLEAYKRGAVTIGRGKKRPHEEERIIFGVPVKKKYVHWEQDLNLITSDYTGVVQVGEVKALSNTDKLRPARPGGSIGHIDVSAGTFGCVCYRRLKLILSNNHVLANSNNAGLEDAILQPGPFDGCGCMDDEIGRLHQFIPLRFMDEDSTCKFSNATADGLNKVWSAASKKSRFKVIAHTNFEDSVFNEVDCALARPLNPDLISDDIIDIGPIEGVATGKLGMPVRKSGRTTGYTEGEIIQTDVTVKVQYGGKVAMFTDQLMAGPMSAPGDSGSAVLNGNHIVGLLFAGSDTTTIINRIENVQNALNVEF
jgi:hypothetical protein